jgi:NADPH-dependent 7-cyano-7-deazaguanine reductase QueF
VFADFMPRGGIGLVVDAEYRSERYKMMLESGEI